MQERIYIKDITRLQEIGIKFKERLIDKITIHVFKKHDLSQINHVNGERYILHRYTSKESVFGYSSHIKKKSHFGYKITNKLNEEIYDITCTYSEYNYDVMLYVNPSRIGGLQVTEEILKLLGITDENSKISRIDFTLDFECKSVSDFIKYLNVKDKKNIDAYYTKYKNGDLYELSGVYYGEKNSTKTTKLIVVYDKSIEQLTKKAIELTDTHVIRVEYRIKGKNLSDIKLENLTEITKFNPFKKLEFVNWEAKINDGNNIKEIIKASNLKHNFGLKGYTLGYRKLNKNRQFARDYRNIFIENWKFFLSDIWELYK